MLSEKKNSNNLDVTKFKACADDKLNLAQMMISVSDRVENIVGKGENAGYQYFQLFPLCFRKASFSASLKVEIVWYRIKDLAKSIDCGQTAQSAQERMFLKMLETIFFLSFAKSFQPSRNEIQFLGRIYFVSCICLQSG